MLTTAPPRTVRALDSPTRCRRHAPQNAYPELSARLPALARRSDADRARHEPSLRVGGIVLDQTARQVRVADVSVDHSRRAFALFGCLMRHPGSRTLRLPVDQAEAIEAIASVDEVSVNEEIQRAISAHIEARRSDPEFRRRLRASIERNSEILERLAR